MAFNRTALVGVHRLSTLVDPRQAPARGRIVERGTHADLLAQAGRYAEMWRLQETGEADAAADENARHALTA